MKGTITKPDSTQLYEDLSHIVLPTTSGEIEILQGHSELFCLLQQGTVTLKSINETQDEIPIKEGLAYFKDNELIIIC